MSDRYKSIFIAIACDYDMAEITNIRPSFGKYSP